MSEFDIFPVFPFYVQCALVQCMSSVCLLSKMHPFFDILDIVFVFGSLSLLVHSFIVRSTFQDAEEKENDDLKKHMANIYQTFKLDIESQPRVPSETIGKYPSEVS